MYNDTKIFGDGVISEGKYNKIKVMGNSTTNGNIECEEMIIMGDAEINGSITAKKVKIMGDSRFHNKLNIDFFTTLGDCNLDDDSIIGLAKIKGDLKAKKDLEVREDLNVSGEVSVQGRLKGNNIKVLGELRVAKALTFDNINVLGGLETSGDCEGNNFYSKGGLKINGLLSADKIEIVPKSRCIIEEIGGSEIIVRKSRWIDFGYGSLTSKVIEGDNIILQDTECEVVRGHNITILEGCSIGKVEYTGKITIDKNSKVVEEVCLKN